MWVVGLGHDQNYYCLDMVRDRLSLQERTKRLFELHRKWRPYEVRYEKYGIQADIEHIKSVQESENYRFDLKEVGGQVKKDDRIGRLIPIFEQGRIYLPKTLYTTDWQKTVVDLVRSFIEEEFAPFPVGLHKDMLDALARICEPDMPLVWPKESSSTVESVRPVRRSSSGSAWMGV